MDEENKKSFENLVYRIIERNVNTGTLSWLNDKALLIRKEENAAQLNLSFAAVPGKSGKKTIDITEDEIVYVQEQQEGFSLSNWPVDRLCRLWLLMQVEAVNKDAYCRKMDNLFKGAEMNELVALYSSLWFFAYPEAWQFRCTEGVRSNIGTVLEAVMYENPYPSRFLDERAWNQLVLKAFFTDKDVDRIIGLDQRANKELASILVDYAHERWAAHRTVNPMLWRLVPAFIDEHIFLDIEKIFNNGNQQEKKAAALVCSATAYPPAKRLLDEDPSLENAIKENTLTWQTL